MTQQQEAEIPQSQNAESSIVTAAISEPKLWAGKYKSVEDLEEAYKNSAKIYQENQNLIKKVEHLSLVPEDYSVHESITLRQNEISEIKQIARESKLNQEQFDKLSHQMASKVKSQLEAFEKAQADVGEANLNVLKDYVKNNYPEKLQQTILTTLIKDKSAMDDAMKHRDQLLNSQVPGGSRAGAGGSKAYDGQNDVVTAAQEYQRNPTPKNREKYINLAAEVAHERFKDK